MRARGSHRRRRQASSCARRSITFGRGSTARDRRSRQSRSGFRRRGGRGSMCRPARARRRQPASRPSGTWRAAGSPSVRCPLPGLAPCGRHSRKRAGRPPPVARCRSRHDRVRGGGVRPIGRVPPGKPCEPRVQRDVRPPRRRRHGHAREENRRSIPLSVSCGGRGSVRRGNASVRTPQPTALSPSVSGRGIRPS